MSNHYLVVFCNCPDETSAEKLAKMLIENQLAACVNLISGVNSIFYWEGKVNQINETLLIIKTMQTHYAALEAMICNHHPYTVPEIIGLPIHQGLSNYLTFIENNLKRPPL